MAKNLTLRSFHSLLTLHLDQFHSQSKGAPKRQCLNWENCISAKSKIMTFCWSKLTFKEKAQYLKLIFPKVTFFPFELCLHCYRNTEGRLKCVFWEQEGVVCSLASVSHLTTQPNTAFAQSSLAVQTQPVQFSSASHTSPQTEVPARAVSLWKKTEIAFLNWMQSPGTI